MASAARMSWWAREGAGGKHGVRTMTVSSPAGQDGIFISYRTGGGSVAVGRLHGRLAHHFSMQSLCVPSGIRLAQSFAGVINNALGSRKLLALKAAGIDRRPLGHGPAGMGGGGSGSTQPRRSHSRASRACGPKQSSL
jgi:hypothetical protein